MLSAVRTRLSSGRSVADSVSAGADQVIRDIKDIWQAARDRIEQYGRECYERGAETVMQTLEAAALEDPCLCVDCAPALPQADGAETCS